MFLSSTSVIKRDLISSLIYTLENTTPHHTTPHHKKRGKQTFFIYAPVEYNRDKMRSNLISHIYPREHHTTHLKRYIE